MPLDSLKTVSALLISAQSPMTARMITKHLWLRLNLQKRLKNLFTFLKVNLIFHDRFLFMFLMALRLPVQGNGTLSYIF